MTEQNIINGKNIAQIMMTIGLSFLTSLTTLLAGLAALNEPYLAYVLFIVSALASLVPGYYISRVFYGLTVMAIGMAAYTLHLGVSPWWLVITLVLLIAFLLYRWVNPKEA